MIMEGAREALGRELNKAKQATGGTGPTAKRNERKEERKKHGPQGALN